MRPGTLTPASSALLMSEGKGAAARAALFGSLPLTFLWLRRGLEAAIGFHFGVDATRFAFAYLINAGLA